MQYWPPSKHYQQIHEYLQKRMSEIKKPSLDWNVRRIERQVKHALENTDIENRIIIMESLLAQYRKYLPRSKL